MSAVPESHVEGAPVPKQDPEALVLRGRPRPVVRFRRGLIIGSAGVVSASLVAVTWLALEPPTFRAVAEEDTGAPRNRPTPDALASVPATYGDVPRLGPALPGDLGRPILEHQRSVGAEGQPGASDPSAMAAERARAAAEAEQQRLAAAREAARTSAVIVQLAGAHGREDAPVPDEETTASSGAAATEPELAEAGQGRRSGLTLSSGGAGSSASVADAPSPWTLSAGTVIAASLITGLNSDLPGLVLAQVTQDVRDSATGRVVLIPQGSRLLGSYDSAVAYGQRRALLAWQRIMLPDGSSVRLDNMPATDTAGYSGVEDRVDFHTWRLLKGIALSTLLGVGTEIGFGGGEGDLVRAIRESTQQNAARAGDRITQRNLDVQPTLTVRPGWPVRAIVHKDLVLRPWKG